MGNINVEVPKPLHDDLHNIKNRNEECPDAIKRIVVEALQDYTDKHRVPVE